MHANLAFLSVCNTRGSPHHFVFFFCFVVGGGGGGMWECVSSFSCKPKHSIQ